MEAEASSKDLLQRFAGSTTISDRAPPVEASPADVAGGDLELSLGLSLGGSFSSNPREKANKLIRSSSVSSSFNFFGLKDDNFQVAPVPLQRTCSLPVPGVDEDYRKRKELQTLKRLEAKRKRSEKRNSLMRGEEGSGCPSHPGSRQATRGLPPVSQGSIGSMGSGSSTGGGGTMQGFEMIRFSKISDAKSLWTANGTNITTLADENTIKKLERRGSGMGEAEMERAAVEEMPCVSTRGSGPNGKRIEGFLYKYRKGEEVRIVCVCHGTFLTPAEFVRHAGGGDVDHPLRHIVVSPSPSPF